VDGPCSKRGGVAAAARQIHTGEPAEQFFFASCMHGMKHDLFVCRGGIDRSKLELVF
jgi:hypothetical protein